MTFECATDLAGYNLIFFVNPSVSISSQSVSLPNGGMMVSFNLTARSEVNGTAVTCRASNGSATVSAYLYIQGQYGHTSMYLFTLLFSGPPDSVINLQGYQLDYCCVFISWDPPYTLPGLTVQYIISVGTEQHELNSTNYTYCPLNLTNKEYLFNITTSNKVGNESTSNITVGFQSSKIILSHSNYTCIIQILNFWPVIKNLIP